MAEILDKVYDPKRIEGKWYTYWEESGFFRARADGQQPPYCIVIPPPNITGSLHMGHALNNTLQDILIRFKRMQGYDTLWMPGTDHAGIATQNVVERMLAEEGLNRHDLGREAFIQRVWQWKETSGGTIITQLKRLGCSCDWSRERFMPDGLSRPGGGARSQGGLPLLHPLPPGGAGRSLDCGHHPTGDLAGRHRGGR